MGIPSEYTGGLIPSYPYPPQSIPMVTVYEQLSEHTLSCTTAVASKLVS